MCDMNGKRLRSARSDDLHRVSVVSAACRFVSFVPAVPGACDRHIPCRLPYLLPTADKADTRRRFVSASKKFRVFCSP